MEHEELEELNKSCSGRAGMPYTRDRFEVFCSAVSRAKEYYLHLHGEYTNTYPLKSDKSAQLNFQDSI